MNPFKSRTVWTIIVMVLITALQSVHELMPEDVYLLVQGILSAFAVYFRTNPKQ